VFDLLGQVLEFRALFGGQAVEGCTIILSEAGSWHRVIHEFYEIIHLIRSNNDKGVAFWRELLYNWVNNREKNHD
jgi:hypothetical protein